MEPPTEEPIVEKPAEQPVDDRVDGSERRFRGLGLRVIGASGFAWKGFWFFRARAEGLGLRVCLPS